MRYCIGIDPDMDFYYDPQQAAPAGFCPICGGEIYRYGEELCDKCKNIEDERNSNYGD